MNSFVGTWALTRLALRLDRVRLAVWVLSLTVVVLVFASAIGDLYPTLASRRQLELSIAANPALTAVLGPAFDLTTVGGLVAWRMSFLPMVLVPLMALLAVVRHTRAEEETGRQELVGSTVVGRRAPLTAALLVAMAASLAIGVLTAAGLAAMGETVAGSLALGASYVVGGWMFAGVAAVAAQLTEGARAAGGIAGAVLGLSYLVRGVGDAAGEGNLSVLSWLSPLGWVLQVRAFAGERWWVLGLAVALTAVLVVAADALVSRRDLGAGLLPSRLGPAEAAPWLDDPLAHAWRLQRGTLAAWAGGLFVLGAMYGSIAAGVADLIDDLPQAAQMLARIGGEQGMIDAFLASTMSIVGLIASIYTVQATLRLRTEETGLRAEPILATQVGRVEWTLSHIAIAAGGTAVVLAAAGLGEGVAHGLRVGAVGAEVPRLVGAALVQWPATLVLAGIAAALFGLVPRATSAAWGALVVFLLLGQIGRVLQLDQWALNLSPFTHIPPVPGGDLTATPLLWLVAVALALTAAGLGGFRRRDLEG